MSMRHMGLCGTKEGFLKGLCLGSPNPEPNAEADLCKASRLHMKEIHLLILKHWYLLGYSLGQTLVDTIFLFSLCLAKVSSTILPPPALLLGIILFFFLSPFSLFLSLLFLFFFSVNAICVLPICLMSASGYHFWALLLYSRALLSSGEEVLHNTGALVFTFGDMVLAAAIQGKTCDHLVRGACIPGSHRTVTIIETVLGRLPFPRHCTNSRLKYTPTVFVKEDICLSRNFSPGDRQWVWHPPTGWPGALKDAARDTIFALPSVWLQFASNSQEGAYKCTWRPNFCDCCQGPPPDSLALGASRAYPCSPIELHTFALLKAAVWGLGFQSAWIKVLTELSPLGHWLILALPQVLRAIKYKIGFLDNYK